jgi:hypothetical protein
MVLFEYIARKLTQMDSKRHPRASPQTPATDVCIDNSFDRNCCSKDRQMYKTFTVSRQRITHGALASL